MPESVKGVMGWTLGVGIIAFILLIMVIIFGNLSGNVGFTQDTATTAVQQLVLSNQTAPVTLTGTSGKTNPSVSSVVVINATNGVVITSGNYTLTDTTITGSGTMTENGTGVNVSYITAFDSQGQIDSDSIILNYTQSATNTSAQFPTVGTIVGIAILLAILIALLVFAIRRMMGVADSRGTSNGSEFGGADRGFGKE